MTACTVIVPVFGPEHLLTACLDALEANTDDYRFIGVDNGTGYTMPNRVIRNADNLGFAVACNQGAALADTEFLVMLNMDTEVQPGWLPPLLEAFDHHPAVGVTGPRVEHLDGRLEGTGIRTWHGEGHAGGEVIRDDLPSRYVDGIGGVCMVIRKSVFHALGNFDAAYVNGYEDCDLCLTAQEAGYRLRYVNESVIKHHGGACGPRGEHTQRNAAYMNEKWGWR